LNSVEKFKKVFKGIAKSSEVPKKKNKLDEIAKADPEEK